MNIANHLTVSRFWMSAILMICMSVDFQYSRIVAFVIFVIASITDALDGHLARSKYGVTTFGKLMDPLADKVLICVAFIGFVEFGVISAWMATLILCREFMVTGLRLLVIEKGVVMAASMWGKVKTTVQMIALSLFFIASILDCGCPLLPSAGSTIAWWMGAITAVLTAWTGVVYFWQQRQLFLEGDL